MKIARLLAAVAAIAPFMGRRGEMLTDLAAMGAPRRRKPATTTRVDMRARNAKREAKRLAAARVARKSRRINRRKANA